MPVTGAGAARAAVTIALATGVGIWALTGSSIVPVPDAALSATAGTIYGVVVDPGRITVAHVGGYADVTLSDWPPELAELGPEYQLSLTPTGAWVAYVRDGQHPASTQILSAAVASAVSAACVDAISTAPTDGGAR